jgi:glycerol-3-phosphate dehydrogenase subunit C
MIDQHDDQDAGRLTPAQQDQVVDECFQCKLCYINCPYIPELHEWALDFPRLMLRTDAMRHATKQVSLRDRATDAVMGHTDLMGKAATTAAPLANKVVGAKPGSHRPQGHEKAATGVSSRAHAAALRPQRFSTWFKKRPGCASPSARVASPCSPPAWSSTSSRRSATTW